MSETVQATRIRVWDPVVRYGHWALAAAFAIAYLTGEEGADGPDALHVWSGYLVGLIVAVRVLWGFVGPPHARFRDFLYGPAFALRYLVDLAGRRAHRYIGHSPAGGIMVIALLACLAGTVGTGLVAYGEQGGGPLAGVKASAITQVHAEQDESGQPGEGRKESTMAELHGLLANLTLTLVILHVLGVGVASIAHRENLAFAMLTGEKRAGE